MRKLLAALFLFSLSGTIFAQSRKDRSLPATASAPAVNAAGEARTAFDEFDATELIINPNSLTREDIERLRRDFLPAVKPQLVKQGVYPERLTRIAAPILVFGGARKTETAVFRHKLPTVFTWQETFITFSTAALDRLTDDEIAALIAHEVGHLYYAAALGRARADKNDCRARIIELKCDLARLHTLSALKIAPENLLAAVKKLIARRAELSAESFQAGSPSLESRELVYQLYINRKP